MKEKHFCSDPLCGKEIQKHSGYIRVGSDYYCSVICWENYLTMNHELEEAANPHTPKKTPRKKWFE